MVNQGRQSCNYDYTALIVSKVISYRKVRLIPRIKRASGKDALFFVLREREKRFSHQKHRSLSPSKGARELSRERMFRDSYKVSISSKDSPVISCTNSGVDPFASKFLAIICFSFSMPISMPFSMPSLSPLRLAFVIPL